MLIGRIDHGSGGGQKIEKLRLCPRSLQISAAGPFDKNCGPFLNPSWIRPQRGGPPPSAHDRSDPPLLCLDMVYERPVHFLDQVNILSTATKEYLRRQPPPNPQTSDQTTSVTHSHVSEYRSLQGIGHLLNQRGPCRLIARLRLRGGFFTAYRTRAGAPCSCHPVFPEKPRLL